MKPFKDTFTVGEFTGKCFSARLNEKNNWRQFSLGWNIDSGVLNGKGVYDSLSIVHAGYKEIDFLRAIHRLKIIDMGDCPVDNQIQVAAKFDSLIPEIEQKIVGVRLAFLIGGFRRRKTGESDSIYGINYQMKDGKNIHLPICSIEAYSSLKIAEPEPIKAEDVEKIESKQYHDEGDELGWN